ESKAIKKFLKELNKLDGFSLQEAVFCMEFTGIYNNRFVYELVKKKANVWLEPASNIKKSLGMVRGKNDKLDAIRIGKYAYKNSDDARLWKPRRGVINKLLHFTTLRRRLLTVKNMLTTPLKEMDLYVEKSVSTKCKNFSKRTLNSIEADIQKVEKEIDRLIKEDPELARQVEVISSINGVGKQTAIGVIVTTNEFKDIRDPKKYACYSGVAPFPNESGIFKGRARVSHLANKKMKTVLHMAALSAIQYNIDLKRYYERKLAEGKNKMSIINAVRNKLIHRIFACVQQDRKYENSYATTLG
ncbi:MAG TPA: IS110 family transposase, partial [Chromatiaceae bacterium]|nr:IS110 family transposase [Chromatiaceae bacterium]